MKRTIISRMNKRRDKLSGDYLRLLEQKILPRFEENRSVLECHLFERHLLRGEPISSIVKDESICRKLEDASNPLKALHNRKQTMLWNIYKLLDRDARAGSLECKDVLFVWVGDVYPAQ